jgi:hypothetical protein
LEAESLIGLMVHGANMGVTDESFLDSEDPDFAGMSPEDQLAGEDGSVIPPAETTPPLGARKTTPASKPKGKPVPVTPHRRGSPVPLKKKVGRKGASAE